MVPAFISDSATSPRLKGEAWPDVPMLKAEVGMGDSRGRGDRGKSEGERVKGEEVGRVTATLQARTGAEV
ncbi:hypothetical protein GCM10010914_05930 [Deinococcus wulumuqiensis]|uniref:Uncharacterized protein n=1 Tax=Deinococcus wulumuqiensis TaxID=980427 RepID=A0AAV4K326_9DEIO|nr:hypothetical protein GCM10010914_05930 [Deinococcus wulumuqiensis]GGP29086.1 hypothetical protein GCM10008021_07370 [Deinococcus wulumuqiensis]